MNPKLTLAMVLLGFALADARIYSPTTGIEGDKVIQRTLYEQMGIGKKREKVISWQARVLTSDRRQAGTDANVYIRIYGDRGISDIIQLDDEKDNFERGDLDTFRFTTPDLGKLYKIRVWHDNSGSDSGWHLNKIELLNFQSQEKYKFKADRWLADDENDRQLWVEIPAESIA